MRKSMPISCRFYLSAIRKKVLKQSKIDKKHQLESKYLDEKQLHFKDVIQMETQAKGVYITDDYLDKMGFGRSKRQLLLASIELIQL